MKKTVIILKMYERAESKISISCTHFNWSGNTSIQISIFKFLSAILGSHLWVLSVHMRYSFFSKIKKPFRKANNLDNVFSSTTCIVTYCRNLLEQCTKPTIF